MAYSEGVPGSSIEEDFSECLRSAADRGEVIALHGKLLDGGTLIDVGDEAIYWEYGVRGESYLYITAYDDRIVLFARCGKGFELRGGVPTVITSGAICNGPATIRQVVESVTDPDFTVFVVGRQFVADGEDGWYHVITDRTGWSGNPIPRSELKLINRGAAVWLSAEEDHSARGQIFSIRRPLAGYHSQIQVHSVSDWQDRVRSQMIPKSFRWAARDLLPDYTAYWIVMKDFVDAVMDDLFHGRANRPPLDVVAHWSGLIHADRIVYHCGSEDDWILTDPSPEYPTPLDTEPECAGQSERPIDTSRSGHFVESENTADLLENLARHIAGTNANYGSTFAATLVMLWERYVPGFDEATALELADRYSVDVGFPIEVNQVSDRTLYAQEILSRMPPELPSDYEPIEPDDLHLRLVLQVGQTYSSGNLDNATVAVSDKMPSCSYFSGNFTINPGGTWNGIKLTNVGGPQEHLLIVAGTPTKSGRVRVHLELVNACSGGASHGPRFIGYSEIIVVDPDEDP